MGSLRVPARYEPVGEVFSGGQGDVHIYSDTFLARRVAIKQLNVRGMGGDLNEEIQLIQSIRSKHVARIYDVLKSDNDKILGIVQEFVDGEDLDTLILNKKPLGRERILKILYQVACGISDIHDANVIHRDIKPDNIKADGEGVVRLFDFGISCFGDDAHTVQRRGSLAYRAPELYKTGPVSVTPAVDVYAFGVLSWLLAMGKLHEGFKEIPPFKKAEVPSFSLISEMKDDVRICQILDACISQNPKERPPMEAVKLAFKNALIKGKHRGVLAGFLAGKFTSVQISTTSKTASVANTGNKIIIKYDDEIFSVTSADGYVAINGIVAKKGHVFPGSCVIALGAPGGARRDFFTFDLSHPEISI